MGGAYGVVPRNGEELHADIIKSDLDPKATFLSRIELAIWMPNSGFFDLSIIVSKAPR